MDYNSQTYTLVAIQGFLHNLKSCDVFVSWKFSQFYLWIGAISGFVMGTQSVVMIIQAQE